MAAPHLRRALHYSFVAFPEGRSLIMLINTWAERSQVSGDLPRGSYPAAARPGAPGHLQESLGAAWSEAGEAADVQQRPVLCCGVEHLQLTQP